MAVSETWVSWCCALDAVGVVPHHVETGGRPMAFWWVVDTGAEVWVVEDGAVPIPSMCNTSSMEAALLTTW